MTDKLTLTDGPTIRHALKHDGAEIYTNGAQVWLVSSIDSGFVREIDPAAAKQILADTRIVVAQEYQLGGDRQLFRWRRYSESPSRAVMKRLGYV